MFRDTIPALSIMSSSYQHGRKVLYTVSSHYGSRPNSYFVIEFHYPTKSLLGILSASYWVGNVLGIFAITPLSDRWGRRMAMFVGSIVAIVGTALCSAAINC